MWWQGFVNMVHCQEDSGKIWCATREKQYQVLEYLEVI